MGAGMEEDGFVVGDGLWVGWEEDTWRSIAKKWTIKTYLTALQCCSVGFWLATAAGGGMGAGTEEDESVVNDSV